jgi:hypothetical protein
MTRYALCLALALLDLVGSRAPAGAEDAAPPAEMATLHLTASLGAAPAPLQAGLLWRVFGAHGDPDGTHPLAVESSLPQPTLKLPPGDYVVHVAFGLASATKSVTVGPEAHAEQLTLAAGALRIAGTLQDKPIDPANLSLAIYVPERNNSQAKLVYAKAHVGDVIGLPEGNYHIVSTFLDTVGVGSVGIAKSGGATNAPVPTNSIVSGDIRVAAGKIVDVTLRHRLATLTLKLVNAPGQGALANSTFTVLTPGGDIIRELIGAFPSLVLAEGEYVVIARHDQKTYQATFQVQSGMDRDVEVVAKDEAKQGP